MSARFDIHQHFGKLIGVPGSPGRSATIEDDRDTRIAFLDSFGIDQCALMPGHSYAAPRGLADVQAINDGLHAYAALAPDRFPAVFGTLDPRHGLANVAEVERLAGMGFRGLSWHHRFQGLPMDHPVMFAIVEAMDAYGMAVLAHCYAQGDFEAPWRLRRLAKRHPRTQFFALDAMTSPENIDQLIEIAETLDNLHLDITSTLLGSRGIERAVRRVGAERLVFGSNYYSMSRVARVVALDAIERAELYDEQKTAILGGNARALLGLIPSRDHTPR
jgi:predicted TIM-barrel fold metal-dependent hydrolase